MMNSWKSFNKLLINGFFRKTTQDFRKRTLIKTVETDGTENMFFYKVNHHLQVLNLTVSFIVLILKIRTVLFKSFEYYTF